MPDTTHKDLLDGQDLSISDLRNLVSKKIKCNILYDKAFELLGHYFQSPVNKAAWTLEHGIKFDGHGALHDSKAEIPAVRTALLNSLGIECSTTKIDEESDENGTISGWLKYGHPLNPEELRKIKSQLSVNTLTNHSLYNQPICRLVHRNQLRYDLDYQTIYQLTPGQSRIIDLRKPPKSKEDQETSHKDKHKSPRKIPIQEVKRNQRAYWGISETFQSLVAMFDSDLGKKDSPLDVVTKKKTKAFIQIGGIAPNELNQYSPLRFWSPPPAFAGSVFHMIFWKSVITGKDLFKRDVIENEKDGDFDVSERANCYYVIVNRFNAAKFRLANYEKLFEALLAIAEIVLKHSANRNFEEELRSMKDLELPTEGPSELLHPNYFPDIEPRFSEFKKLNLILPLESAGAEIWDLAQARQSEKDQPTRISDLLKFLRDKAVEILIWSRYQMEIRSVGLIPIQHLYGVHLTDIGKVEMEKLARKFERYKKLCKQQEAKGNKDSSQDATSLITSINKTISRAMKSGSINDWVKLKKVAGGTYRTIHDHESLNKIKKLKSPRAKFTDDSLTSDEDAIYDEG